ncbi:hypothetical protein [Fictibacillus sp. NRS-1165]|uniref:hypothetical protein n=1 Tax=Fictibacillus sp. NRS-1165 TaxID=3144463 RepID=UPI003D2417BA
MILIESVLDAKQKLIEGDQMSGILHSFLKDWQDTAKHVRYIAFRSRETYALDEKGVFSEKEDRADVETFLDSVNNSRPLRSPYKPYIHRLLFSMSQDEWDRSGFEVAGDYQTAVRNTMKRFELKKGYRLEWVAAQHQKKGNPHVHVALKASYTDRDGVEKFFPIKWEEVKELKQTFKEELDQIRGFELNYDYEKKFDRYRTHEHPIFSKPIDTTFIDSLFYEMNRRLEEEKRARERAQGQRSR